MHIQVPKCWGGRDVSGNIETVSWVTWLGYPKRRNDVELLSGELDKVVPRHMGLTKELNAVVDGDEHGFGPMASFCLPVHHQWILQYKERCVALGVWLYLVLVKCDKDVRVVRFGPD